MGISLLLSRASARRTSMCSIVLALCVGLCLAAGPARAQAPKTRKRTASDVEQQLEEMRQMIREQNRVIEELRQQIRDQAQPPPAAAEPAAQPPRTEVPKTVRQPEATGAEAKAALSTTLGPFQVGYDKGFVIQPVDREKTPYRLRITGRMQFRYTLFQRDESRYTDSSGKVYTIEDRNDFEIERGRLTFDGYALDPKLGYFINFDFDTDDNHDVIIHDFWIYYLFGDAFILHAGKAFVPGSREWLMGSTTTRFADRSMATTFFRPDRSIGIWALGEPIEDVYYRSMLSNGFNTTDLTFEDIDRNFAWATSVWWDVFGNFGSGWSDLEGHASPGILTGTSFTMAEQDGPGPVGQPSIEQNFVRLSDGTRLTQTGALAPGITVDEFDIYLWAIDFAAKYKGLGVNWEYYLRWIDGLHADGPLPLYSFFDHGFYLETGYMIVPRYVEIGGRMSHILGRFGSRGAEYGGVANWFINGTQTWKFTVDATRVRHSPAQNSAPGYRIGDDGVMVRGQIQVGF
ncbi:hypothetical protein L6Q96_11120 [Candidatus Binatia bacterium]|nr:hypothetical protein [Candidatus Binatia bacterium]